MSGHELPFKCGLHVATVRHLALRLSQAEASLHTLTGGAVDAVLDNAGNPYLLRVAQEQIRQNESRVQTLLDSVPDVIIAINQSGKILVQSAAATRVLGYDPEELVGQNIFELVHSDDVRQLYHALFGVIEKFSANAAIVFRVQTHDGSWRMFEAVIGPLLDPPESRNLVLTLRDPSGSRQEQEDADQQEAARERGRFLATLSHELRSPLAPALLGVQVLLEDERFAEAKPDLEMIRRNIELESRLLEGLLDFTEISQGKLRLRLESVDAHKAVHAALKICHGEIAARQIDVRLQLQAEEHFVRADAAKLQQIIWNLVKNAVKFSEPGGAFTITSSDANGQFTLEFSDQGLGVDAALLPKMFDAFQQGDTSVHGFRGGIGLGLFIAKKFAEAQEGTLTASSEGRGKGATFRLSLKTAPETME